MNQQRDFKGVWIPKEIWGNKELTLIEKIIIVEVDSLDVDGKGCYLTNDYFAKFCNCSKSTVTRSIKKLIDLGLLYQEKFDGRRRYLKSAVKVSIVKLTTLPKQIDEADYAKRRGSNLINNINNKINNNKKEIYKEKRKPTLEEIQKYCEERNNDVDPKKFYDYYSVNEWKDKDGKQVKNWKQKVITWEGRGKKERVAPEWFDKNLEITQATDEEQKEMQNMLNNY